MTVIRPNSISGITSLTAHRGSIDFYAHDGSAATFNNINSNVTSGVSTFASLNITGDLDVGGALTYEDVTNVDSIGVVTARDGIHVTGDNKYLKIGAGNDISLVHTGAESFITNATGHLTRRSDVHKWENYDGSSEYFRIISDGTLRQSGSSNALGQGTSVAKLTHYTIDGTTPGGVGDVTTLETISATSNGSDYKFIITKREGSGGGSCFINLGGNSDGSISFGTNTSGSGTERLRITSAGLVGIGEESPDRLLHIKGSSSTAYSGGSDTADYNFLKIENTTNDKSAGIFFAIGSNGEAAITATEVVDGNTDIAFQNRGGGVRSEKLRITSAGRIGINEATPDAQLHVRGSGNSSGLTFLSEDSSGNNTFWIQDGGKVGVHYFPFAINRDSTDTIPSSTYFYVHSASPFAIKNDGKVGINDTNPRAKLDVRGTALIADDIGSTLPSTFPASDVQLMVYTSTNGQPITNTNCARILLATDAKQTGPQGYNGAIDFGNSDATASSQNSQYNYRVASIMSQALADTESNAADGNLEFWTKTSTGSLSQKMGISAEGYVTKPAHPCFDAIRNSGHMNATTYINYNTVNINIGGCYNSSNGRFTAPVSGYYFFSWGTIKNATNAVTRLYIHKNGTQAYGGRHLRMDAGQDYGDNGAMTVVIQLAKNDYVQIYLGAGGVYGVTQEYCFFNGYLLG